MIVQRKQPILTNFCQASQKSAQRPFEIVAQSRPRIKNAKMAKIRKNENEGALK